MQTEHECRPVFGRLPNGSYVCSECKKPYSGVEIRYTYRTRDSFYEWRRSLLPFKWENMEIIFFFNKGYLYKMIKAGRSLYIIAVDDRLDQVRKEHEISWYSLFMLHRAQLRWKRRRFEARSLYLQNRFNLSSHLANYLTSFISPVPTPRLPLRP